MKIADVVSVITRIHPSVYDAIFPRGLQRHVGTPSQIPHAGPGQGAWLNPQPLPPRTLAESVQLEAAAMSQAVIQLAVNDNLRGNAHDFQMLREFIDEWCKTPWPRKWPLPRPVPGPWPFPGPSPDPWIDGFGDELVRTSRLVGAMVFSSAADGLGDEALRTALRDGAERLMSAAADGQ